MKSKKIFQLSNIVLFTILFLSFFLIEGTQSCKSISKPNNRTYLVPDTSNYARNFSLNILLTEGLSLAKKQLIIENVKDSIRQFYIRFNYAFNLKLKPKFDFVAWCPCDSTLFNINFTCVDASGKSAASPPPTEQLKGEGGLLGVVAISNNGTIKEYTKKEYIDTVLTKNRVRVKNIPTDTSKILAIIDSGIDTTLFEFSIKNMLWANPSGASVLYNFLPNQNIKDFLDDGEVKHGSAVASLAINAMRESLVYPKLMILKALDKNDKGSVFSVSCALSYAIQNNATLVNASLGYKGKPDTIMQHYIELCALHKPNPIQLFVAAGNTDDFHILSGICDNNYNANFLHQSTFLFYPACFSPGYINITSVTQIREPNEFCHYQYYSQEFISLGVLNMNNCCSFKVDFRRDTTFYEGSSFATPIASGVKMASILSSQNMGLTNSDWDAKIKTAPKKWITKNGHYIIYKGN